MKLERRLNIGGTLYPVIEERVILDLNSPGRAEFMVNVGGGGPVAELAPVAFDLAWANSDDWQRLFLGYVESITPVDYTRQRLFCRELAGALRLPLPLALRHCAIPDVCNAIADAAGLSFSIPDADYSRRRIPNFYNLGSGYNALDHIGAAFQVDDYLWQQQGGGVVYVGTWTDSRYAGREVDAPDDLFHEHLASDSARIAAVPALRPGVSLNGSRIKRLEFQGNHMVVTWTTR
ncbi:hypothetical protein [Methylomagnum ishizawai]|uniref:hypothetical protein n=1 Tax=Methylomagnum ishizawai TaxID=1760988 RepID=UPI001C337BAC|nr:hypothetical protein [Methylomagnum ishizawai]BBL73958.1 hypothetical protein MishRS11D_10560 [Methylomagnum ishizawai]